MGNLIISKETSAVLAEKGFFSFLCFHNMLEHSVILELINCDENKTKCFCILKSELEHFEELFDKFVEEL